MTAQMSATQSNGYNWLLAGVVFLVWGFISGLIPRFFQLLVLIITPKIIYRHKANAYKVLWLEEKRKAGYFEEKYKAALVNAMDVEIELEETKEVLERFGFRPTTPEAESAEAEWLNRKFEN